MFSLEAEMKDASFYKSLQKNRAIRKKVLISVIIINYSMSWQATGYWGYFDSLKKNYSAFC